MEITPPPSRQKRNCYRFGYRGLLTREVIVYEGSNYQLGGSIGKWSHVCVKLLILITTIIIKFSLDWASH